MSQQSALRQEVETQPRGDESLMLAYQAGDISAYEALVRRHSRAVLEFLKRMLRDETLAEDALAETFFNLHRAAPTYTPTGRFARFLYTIAYREGINVIRARMPADRAWPALSPHGARSPHGPHSPDDPLEGLIASTPDPEAGTQHRQMLNIVDDVLETIPERERAVFLMYHQQGLRTPEIAEVMAIPVGSVRAYLTNVRKSLREALERLESSPGGFGQGVRR